MQYENFHGHNIAIGTRDAYKAAVEHALDGESCTQIITINPEYIVLSRNQELLKHLSSPPALAIPDGIGLTWALAARGYRVERYPGSEMILDICTSAQERNLKIAVVIPKKSLSNRDEIIGALQKSFPKLQCLVFSEEENIVASLQTHQINVLFVTFGQPRQDIWIAEHIGNLPQVKLAIGVGGSFDFLTGKRVRAPRIMRVLGLEWLWRFITQPWRLPRILRATFGFWYVILTTP